MSIYSFLRKKQIHYDQSDNCYLIHLNISYKYIEITYINVYECLYYDVMCDKRIHL